MVHWKGCHFFLSTARRVPSHFALFSWVLVWKVVDYLYNFKMTPGKVALGHTWWSREWKCAFSNWYLSKVSNVFSQRFSLASRVILVEDPNWGVGASFIPWRTRKIHCGRKQTVINGDKIKRQRDEKQLRFFPSFINHALLHLETLS